MGDGEERTEASTAKHRTEARRRGTVAKSHDLVNAAIILVLLLVLPTAAASLAQGALVSTQTSFLAIPMASASAQGVLAFANTAVRPYLGGFAMLVGTIMAVSLAVNFAQVGFVLSGESLIPNFTKLNPLSGISRLFSRNSVFDAGKAILKTSLFTLIAYTSIRQSWTSLLALDRLAPVAAVSTLCDAVRGMAMRIGFTWAGLAGLDYYIQRTQIDRQLRMTKQEVKREMRESEMAPELKSARNARRRRLMRKRLREAVKSADVVVTNPTHFAVALRYEPGKAHAPIVVAKGVDYLAAKIREEAALHEIPLVANPPLARALYKQCEIGDYVPRELFQAVAEVLAYVYRTLKRRGLQ